MHCCSSQLPADVYKLLPFALAPIMSNPISMALNDVDSRAPLPQQASDLLYVSGHWSVHGCCSLIGSRHPATDMRPGRCWRNLS